MSLVSILIPCKRKEEAENCISHCLDLNNQDFEIIVLPDYNISHPEGRIKYICTGEVKPSEKRDIGLKYATGKWIAFIDSDAYPDKEWLDHLPNTASGVCGAGILPPNSPMEEQISDWILKWTPFRYRVVPCKSRFVKDFPTFNLILRKDLIDEVGGFGCDNYLTGEDSLICQKITEIGGKILYNKKCFVYHQRRPIYKPFFKQIWTYGKHRGHQFKKGEGNSRNPIYLLPSLCVLSTLFLAIWVLFMFMG